MKVRIQTEDFDVNEECARLADGKNNIGAIVTFTGLCRDEEGRLSALELEHYPGMAEAKILEIVEQAESRWPLQGVTVIHRVGRIKPGANIVLVVTASSHRRAAFEAAEFLMDFLKTSAPFWKKEHPADAGLADANTATETRWVSAQDADDEATKRWQVKE